MGSEVEVMSDAELAQALLQDVWDEHHGEAVLDGDNGEETVDPEEQARLQAAAKLKTEEIAAIEETLDDYTLEVKVFDVTKDDFDMQYVDVNVIEKTVVAYVLPGSSEVTFNRPKLAEVIQEFVNADLKDDEDPNEFKVSAARAIKFKRNIYQQHTCVHFTSGGHGKAIKVSETSVEIGRAYRMDILHPSYNVCSEPKVVQIDNREEIQKLPYANCGITDQFKLQANCNFYTPEPMDKNFYTVEVKSEDGNDTLHFATSRMGIGKRIYVPTPETWDFIGSKEAFTVTLEPLAGSITNHMGYDIIRFQGSTLESENKLSIALHEVAADRNAQLEQLRSVRTLMKGTFLDHVRRN